MITTYQTFVQSKHNYFSITMSTISLGSIGQTVQVFHHQFRLLFFSLFAPRSVTRNDYYKLSIWPKFLVGPNF